MKKTIKYSLAGLMSAAVITASAFTAFAADVDVYAEGAYTDTDLVVYLYADINTIDPLVSAGVSLNYNSGVLAYVSSTKNETDWYFGEPSATHDYVDPDDTAGTGKVTYLLGKIRESIPTEGVAGSRVFLGTATFSHGGVTLGGATPEDFFGVTLSKGKDETTFANFVTNTAVEVDGNVNFDAGNIGGDPERNNVIIRQRGDAKSDQIIDFQDLLVIKGQIQTGTDYHVIMDCKDDRIIDFQDLLCVKNIIQN